MNAPKYSPLHGIRVLDLGVMLSSPFAARTLSDLGAEVVKVEGLEGDPQRSGAGLVPGSAPTAIFASIQRNRLGVAIDLKLPRGQRVVHDLARKADVVIANFRPGVAKRLACDYETLAAINRGLIHCSITGFGEASVLSQMPVTDGVIQAFAGVMELTGEAGHPGPPFRMVIADQIAGACASQAILAALVGRERTGAGCHIEINMLDCMLSWLHTVPRFEGLSPGTLLLEASDGRSVLVQTPLQFQERFVKLVAALPGFESFATDARFKTRENRLANFPAYREAVQLAFRTRTAAEWLSALSEASVPASPVHTVAEALAHAEVAASGRVAPMALPGGDEYTMVTAPFHIDGTRCGKTDAPPWLGQHTTQVLAALAGYSQAQIENLRADGVVR